LRSQGEVEFRAEGGDLQDFSAPGRLRCLVLDRPEPGRPFCSSMRAPPPRPGGLSYLAAAVPRGKGGEPMSGLLTLVWNRRLYVGSDGAMYDVAEARALLTQSRARRPRTGPLASREAFVAYLGYEPLDPSEPGYWASDPLASR
jgi:hypothetical protein